MRTVIDTVVIASTWTFAPSLDVLALAMVMLALALTLAILVAVGVVLAISARVVVLAAVTSAVPAWGERGVSRVIRSLRRARAPSVVVFSRA